MPVSYTIVAQPKTTNFMVAHITGDVVVPMYNFLTPAAKFARGSWHQLVLSGDMGGGVASFQIKAGSVGFVPINGLSSLEQKDFNAATKTWNERADAAGDEWQFVLTGSMNPDLYLAWD